MISCVSNLVKCGLFKWYTIYFFTCAFHHWLGLHTPYTYLFFFANDVTRVMSDCKLLQPVYIVRVRYFIYFFVLLLLLRFHGWCWWRYRRSLQNVKRKRSQLVMHTICVTFWQYCFRRPNLCRRVNICLNKSALDFFVQFACLVLGLQHIELTYICFNSRR